jgi:sugar lactone lactonase YvrE
MLMTRDRVSIFCGGILSPHRLDHPEGLCVDPRDGAIWCGGEGGQLYRISPNGHDVREVARTGGFLLGVTLDAPTGRLYLCDLHHACVWVYADDGRPLARWTGVDGDERLRLPNYAVLSPDRRWLYVSDTRRGGGPGVWRFDLASGRSELWMRERCLSANGLALSPEGDALYLVESHLPGVARIPIRADGTAGSKEAFLDLPGDEPDGLAFDAGGNLWISIYNPSRIYRRDRATGALAVVFQDDTTDLLHHATNLAFRGPEELFVANLGAWHLTRLDLSGLRFSS